MKVQISLAIIIALINTTGSNRAVCDEKLPLSSHGPNGWCGPWHKDIDSAKADAENHNKKYDHKASVCTGECPTCPVN
ncbi:hypothetical protein FPE01S_01_13290 [Flavihumibacter petaseus NBRC 106054]|uniref:Uncharacterized protein n=1 Tax=Flavihumibacter petaseus NBRC 106054 TaxID=1220578 RepID=A0A0E9MYX7_9BACT|nr:hypothetical protein FPE01S_01_13290 [Flavihumibacter petaseus NBRC 106054]